MIWSPSFYENSADAVSAAYVLTSFKSGIYLSGEFRIG